MKLPNARYRVVNFRLSSSEYEAVFCACQAEGVRTVSEFARSSILRRIQGEPVSGGSGDLWIKLSERLSNLERCMEQVLKAIQTEECKQESGAEANEKGN